MDTLESTKENLLLCNKAPQNLVALNSKHLLSHSFSMSGIWAQESGCCVSGLAQGHNPGWSCDPI